MRLGLFSPALSRRRRTLILGGAAPDTTQSTYTSSAFANAADGATSTTLTFTAKDAAGNAMATMPLAWSVERITLAAGDPVVTAAPSTIDDDGADRSYITLTALDASDRPLRGIPAANCVLAATGSGNTVTQPATATDLNGQTSGYIVSTVAATKVASYTVLGVAITDTASVVVEAAGVPTVYAESAFTGGTISPFTDVWGNRITVISDPTGSGRGNLVEITYAPASGGSMERALKYTHGSQLRYGATMWVKADLYQLTGGGNYDANHNRKLFDYQGSHVRMTLHRRDGVLRFSAVDAMTSGTETEVIAETTGITINDNTWYTVEVRMVTNSADNVRDGLLEVYINGAVTPSYVRSTGLGWITENGGASYFQGFFTGFQLTIDSGDGTYTDTRYWDNITYSDLRI